MSRVAFLFVLLSATAASAADLPSGALARLGDDRFRAGGEIEYLALSPDGKQVATVAWISKGVQSLAVWDAATGHPLREYKVNRQLFKGFVWGEGGPFAVVLRAEPATKDNRAKVFQDDFRVWDFTKAAPPLLAQDTVGLGSPTWWVDADWPREGPEYTLFQFSADGRRVAALWKTAQDKYAVHVFELAQAKSSANLRRVGALDLGAEGVDDIHISSDGRSVVTFRKLADGSEMTATRWSVTTGKPAKPARVPLRGRHMLAPDGRSLVKYTTEGREWGFDLFDLATGKSRELGRWRYSAAQLDGGVEPDCSGFAFTPDGRELVVAADRKTFVIDIVKGKELARLEGHANTPGCVAVSADGSCIATADWHGFVRFWDAKRFRPLHEAPGHRAEVKHAQLSPDNKLLLTSAPDRTVRLWDIATGKELRAFVGVADDYAPRLTSDGTAVIYRSKDALIARDLQTGLEVPLPKNADELEPRAASLSTARLSARLSLDGSEVWLSGSDGLRRTLTGHRGLHTVLGFTPDGTKLLTAGGDHTVLVWDMRLQAVPLPEAFKKETDAAKLWNALATGKSEDAYLAMARLARDPDAAVKMAKMKLKPAAKGGRETDATQLADTRAVELLEALDTDDTRALLKELASGHADAFRTQEAKRAVERTAERNKR